jgi:hypothetical protein
MKLYYNILTIINMPVYNADYPLSYKKQPEKVMEKTERWQTKY